MQISRIALVAALAVPALAIVDMSLISKLPSCAIAAASSALTGGACGTDIECACKDSSFVAGLSTDVKAVCSAADVAKTIDVAKELCLSVGVTVQIPDDGAATLSSTAAPVASTSPEAEPTPSPSPSVGGWDEPLPTTSPSPSVGGWDEPLPTTSPSPSVGGWDEPLPTTSPSPSVGGWDEPLPTSSVAAGSTTTVYVCDASSTSVAIPTASVQPSASHNGTSPTPTKLRPTLSFTGAAAAATGHIAAGVIGVAGFLAFL